MANTTKTAKRRQLNGNKKAKAKKTPPPRKGPPPPRPPNPNGGGGKPEFDFYLRVITPTSLEVEAAILDLDPTVAKLEEQPAYLNLAEEFQPEYLETMKIRTQIAFALQVAAQTGTFGGNGSLITTTDFGTFRVETTDHEIIDDGMTVRWVVRTKVAISGKMREVLDKIYAEEEGMTEEQKKFVISRRRIAELIGPSFVGMVKDLSNEIGVDALRKIILKDNHPKKSFLDEEEIEELDAKSKDHLEGNS